MEISMDAGLEKVVAAETVLSDVQGEAGRLIIRGLEVEDLASGLDFEATAQHLWAGSFPEAPTREALGQARAAAFERLKPHFGWLGAMPEVEGLRAALALVPDGHDLKCAIDLAAMTAVASGAIAQLKAGHAPLPPDAKAGHAADM